MKQLLLIYFILLSTFSYSQNTMSADSFLVLMEKKNNDFINKPFPQFSVATNNKECSNSTLKGKVVFINFWFAACAPCMAEMEELNKLFEKYKHDKNFQFVSFTFEKSKKIALIKKKFKIDYPVYSISQDECYRLNNNNGFPTSVILDSTGTVQYIHSGDQLNKQEIKKYFNAKVYPLLSKDLL
ncbi:MAG TPA: TlpA disulfide reductase family protein [Ginsengibacter sp.]